MLWRDVATLVKVKTTKDGEGYTAKTETRREVFVDTQSVRRSEFYAARQSGTTVAIVFLVRAADYDGETRVEYKHPGAEDATVYSVIRTYTKAGEILELNCSLESSPGSVVRRGSQNAK